jgi:D-glycero-alpha-D-manno-heptose-7-phosphate kinase
MVIKKTKFSKDNFILTKTPHRVSFFGGGTDLESFYRKSNGITFSTAINKYVYVGVKRHTNFFDERYRIVYSETELQNKIYKIKNDIVRETLKFCNFIEPLYINSISDLPSGTGLGSSSAFTVGLLKGIYSLMNIKKKNIKLAEEACEIEINRLKKPIGKQDQYACALGGVNLIKYNSSGLVSVKKNDNIRKFIKRIMFNSLFIFTGISRESSFILNDQNSKIKNQSIQKEMLQIKYICQNIYDEISNYDGKNFDYLSNFFVKNINTSWNIKKTLHNDMTNEKINKIIKIVNLCCENKVGIKLLGAGAGGFILVSGIKNIEYLKKILQKKKILFFNASIDVDGSVLV